MKLAAFLLLACLLFVHVKGMVISPRGRCQCIDRGVKFIPPKQIEKIEVFSPSTSCKDVEIIATMKISGDQMCLDPDSQFAKNLIKKLGQTEKRHLE
ncbi:hypothetical protein AGOR_G00008170 [Albula goreensis]|uniref:C-X-C motif chemokine n=1 Tax=Albula goreensis TaxID=1534307 RepID=A0A8T3EBK3_9TELE|nr:hypothetical protein AGOR_G00008170 [Albula goreensis]